MFLFNHQGNVGLKSLVMSNDLVDDFSEIKALCTEMAPNTVTLVHWQYIHCIYVSLTVSFIL